MQKNLSWEKQTNILHYSLAYIYTKQTGLKTALRRIKHIEFIFSFLFFGKEYMGRFILIIIWDKYMSELASSH